MHQRAAELPEALDVAVGRVVGVRVPRRFLVTDSVHVRQVDARFELLQFLLADLSRVHAQPLLHGHVAHESLRHALGNQENPTALHVPAIASDHVVEIAENLHRPLRHPHQLFVRIVLAQKGGRPARSAGSQQVFLNEHHVLQAALREIVCDGRSVDTRPDDNHIRRLHPNASFRAP